MNDRTNDGVKLLSGGNPQIPKGDGEAPVQAYLAAMPDWKGEIGRHIDDLVGAIVPDVRKAVRWNSPFYGIEDNGWFLSMHCFTKYVKLTWLNGAQLDPPPPIAATDERVRYSHITADEVVDDDQLRAWIIQASRTPGDPLF